MKKYTIYTVGPITGLSYDECVEHFQNRVKIFTDMGYNVLCLMTGKGFLRNELKFKSHGYKNNPVTTNHAIVQIDFWRVDNADIIHVDFTKAKTPSIGSIAEMSRAFYQGKLIITVLPEGNVHEHCFILEMSSLIFKTLDESYNYLRKFIVNTIYDGNTDDCEK